MKKGQTPKKLVTLLNEDTLRESKIESIVLFVRRDLRTMPNRDTLITKLESSLRNIEDVRIINSLEKEFSDENITTNQIAEKIMQM